MTNPTFMVVGAQKAATTWLFECLNEHNQIFVPKAKEVHFFCPSDRCRFSTAEHGVDWYQDLFPEGGYRALGELTTDYMYYPDTAEKLYRFNPSLKIVFMLRNPVDRAYSAYWMWRRHNPDLPDFRTMLDREPGYIKRGYYYRQIQPYVELFGLENIRVYIYEEIMDDLERFFEDIYGFVGADKDFRPKNMRQPIAATQQYSGGVGRLLYKIASPIINHPVILPIWRFLRTNTGFRDWIVSLLAVKSKDESGYPSMSAADRAHLENVFENENQSLSEFLAKPVSYWQSSSGIEPAP